MANVEAGTAAKGVGNLVAGGIEVLGSSAINSALIEGTFTEGVTSGVDVVLKGPAVGFHELGNTVTHFASSLEGGAGGVLGGITVLFAFGDGIRRVINGGVQAKEGFGR